MLEFCEMIPYLILEQSPVDEGEKGDHFKGTLAGNRSLKIKERLKAYIKVGPTILVEAIRGPVIFEQWKLQNIINHDQVSSPFFIN